MYLSFRDWCFNREIFAQEMILLSGEMKATAIEHAWIFKSITGEIVNDNPVLKLRFALEDWDDDGYRLGSILCLACCWVADGVKSHMRSWFKEGFCQAKLPVQLRKYRFTTVWIYRSFEMAEVSLFRSGTVAMKRYVVRFLIHEKLFLSTKIPFTNSGGLIFNSWWNRIRHIDSRFLCVQATPSVSSFLLWILL